MENLCNDVSENILYRLPFMAASRAKRVFKSWKTLLDDRCYDEVPLGFLFAHHVRNYKANKIQLYFGEEYDHIDCNKMNYYSSLIEMEHCRFSSKSYNRDILVGSCNGLVCLQKEDPGIGLPEAFAICNPLTGEFISLKDNMCRVKNEPDLVSTGFGYCQSTKEYKVVRIYTLDWQQSRVQVYTIGSNEWRDKKTCIDYRFGKSGVFANGVLHWLNDNEDGKRHIAAFDLQDEKFRSLPLPPSEGFELEDSYVNNELKVLGGNLCWVQKYRTRNCINIWTYKRNNISTNDTRYGTDEHDQRRNYYSENHWNWVKEFSIEYCGDGDYNPFAITKSNQVLLLGTKNFYCYDSITRTTSKLGDDNGGMGCSNIQVIPHANSYVSLKDFGETWYGPGCSAVPQTNSHVSLTEARDAYRCRKRRVLLIAGGQKSCKKGKYVGWE